jgi:hypothetical protein
MPSAPDFLDVININTGLLEKGRRLFVPGGARVGGLSFSEGGLE